MGHLCHYLLTKRYFLSLDLPLAHTHPPLGVPLILAPQAQGPVQSLSQCADSGSPLPCALAHFSLTSTQVVQKQDSAPGHESVPSQFRCPSTPLPPSGATLGLGKPSLPDTQPDRCP